MREETRKQLDNVLGAMVIPQSTEDKLVRLVEDLEVEIETSKHNIHYLEQRLSKSNETA